MLDDGAYNPLRCEQHGLDIRQIVDRVQQLVDEYHEGRVMSEHMRGEVTLLCQRVPADLPTRLATIEIQVHTVMDDVKEIKEYVKVLTPMEQFALLRAQVYAFAFIIIAGFVAALGSVVYRGIK